MKEGGDALLHEYLGNARDIAGEVRKARQSYFTDTIDSGTLLHQATYPLDSFRVPDRVCQWPEEESHRKVLILCGAGGLGRAEMILAVLFKKCSKRKEVHFLNEWDDVRNTYFEPGQCLLMGEVCMCSMTINQAKA